MTVFLFFPAVQASLTFEQASSFPPSWNDKMIFTSNIIDDSFFRKIVKIIVEKTVEYKITGIVFYPLTESSYRFSVGEQIKKFTEQVEALGSSGRKYLRVIWFVVDESGIYSAENCLLSVPTRSLMTLFSIAGNSSWEKTSQSKTADKISLNVIGPDKTAVDSFLAEMKSILSQPQHTSQEPPSLQTSTIQSVGYLTPLTNEIRQHSGKLKEGPDLDLENGTPVDDLSTQNYEVQGARPKQGRMGPGQPAGISEPNSTVTEIQALKEEDSLIFDTIMVTANINQGILSFLKEKGDNYFHDWIKQLGKVFKVALVSDAEKVSINGSLMHVKALCNYLNTAFPKNPEEVDYKADESDSKEDSVECDGVLVTTSSKNYVVYQYLMDKVLLSVYLGDLTQVNVDCIVSTATPNLKGALGLEKNVLESAGADVLTACDIYRQKIKTLQPGESLITTGGKLRCKKIIHFAFPFKGSSSNQQELEAAFTSCFRNVENEGLLSVAISGVGSVLTKEHECVIQSLHRAVETLNTRRYSTVQHIHFVDKKTRLLKLVMDAFISNFSCLQINKATIYIVKGDITSLKADALVVFQDSDFSMSSNIAKKIACVSGDHYSLDLNDLKLMNSRPGNILVKKSRGDLATVCGYLLHAVVLQSKGDEKEKKVTTVEVFQDTLDKIMATCKENNIVTLGVPVFDVRELNVKKFFQAMAEFMFEYFCTNDTNIKAVHFMSEDETSVRTFIHCLHKQIDNADKFKKKGKPLSLRNRRP